MNKIIIADTSCLIALTNVGLLNVLKGLYEEVFITPAVKEEFGRTLPIWIKTRKVKNSRQQSELETTLDEGEASSIAPALEIKNSLLIIDEIKGRRVAESHDIAIIGTIGVLLQANKKGLISDFISVLLRLVNKGFRLSNKLLDSLIEQYGKK